MSATFAPSFVTVNPKPEAPLASWEDVEAVFRPYEEIWEKDGVWLMGRQNLPAIVDHWRAHFPEPMADRYRHSVTVVFPFPTVRDEISGCQVSLLEFTPDALCGILEDRLQEVGRLRWRTWAPELEGILGAPLNALSLNNIKSLIYATEQRAAAMGLPELWQIGAAAFGLSPWGMASK